MGILIRIIFVLLVLLPSAAWGACTYGTGTITCTMDSVYDDTQVNSSGNKEEGSWVIVPWAATDRPYIARYKVSIPKNATITSAKMSFKMIYDATACTDCVTAALIDSDNYPALTNDSDTDAASGSPVTFSAGAKSAGDAYDTADLSTLIQSWIGRVGYDYGYYVGLRFNTTGTATNHIAYQAYSSTDSSYWPTLTITYTGGDPVLDYFMAPPHVRTKQYIRFEFKNRQAGDKLKVDLDGGTVSNETLTADTVDVLVDYTSLTAGEHNLRFVVTNSEGVEYATTVKSGGALTWTTLHDGYPTIGINENNAMCKKSGASCSTFFPIADFWVKQTFWPPYVTEPIPIIPITNTSHTPGLHNTLSDIKKWDWFLDTAATQGRMYIGPGDNGSTNKRTGSLARMSTNSTDCVTPTDYDDCSFVNYTKSHSALFGWNWGDEPNLGEDTGTGWTRANEDDGTYQGLKQYADAVRTVDTNHPVFVTVMGTENNFIYSASDRYARVVTYFLGLNSDKAQITDVWTFDYYPYEYKDTVFNGNYMDLENFALSMDYSYSKNKYAYPVMIHPEVGDLHDWYGYISSTWAASTAYIANRQLRQGGRIYRQSSGASCTSGGVEPSWPSAIGDTVADNDCTWIDEGTGTWTYAALTKTLNIATWDSGTFQAGERVCAQTGGCATAGGFIGRPRYSQTAASYIRKPADHNNYQYNQLVLSSADGTFTTGMKIVGQTSGAIATVDASTVWYMQGSLGWEKDYDWTPSPTAAQVSNFVWLSVIHGAKGIIYFDFFTTAPTANYTILGEVKDFLESYKDVVLGPVSTKSTPVTDTYYSEATVSGGTGARVDYTIRDGSDGYTYIFAARLKKRTGETFASGGAWPDPTNTNSVTATIPVTGLSGETIYTYDTTAKTWTGNITAGSGSFTDTFNDYDAKIYRYESGVAVTQYALSVSVTGDGSGTVTSSPAGISTSASSSVNFNADTEVTLTASAASGSNFSGWSDDCSGTSTCVLTMSAAKNATATFAADSPTPPTYYLLSIAQDGDGSVTVTSDDAAVNCSGSCSVQYSSSKTVVLTVTPHFGSYFVGWSGDGTGTTTRSVEVGTADKAVTYYAYKGPKATIGSGPAVTVGAGPSLYIE